MENSQHMSRNFNHQFFFLRRQIFGPKGFSVVVFLRSTNAELAREEKLEMVFWGFFLFALLTSAEAQKNVVYVLPLHSAVHQG